jgi:mannose-6-phosphate isomerase
LIRGHLKLEPILVARPWGGEELAKLLRRERAPHDPPMGEAWIASDVEGNISRVATGPHKGEPITALLGAPLPLLVKIIDAQHALSLQVHPDEEAARAIGKGAAPKTEAWHVLAADPMSWVVLGLTQGTSIDALLVACRAGDPRACLRKVEVEKGDTIFVPAGTVHAIGPGLVFYEVQQPSDTTWRLHDWGRVGLDGKPRALHIDEARRSIHLDSRPEVARKGDGMLAASRAFRLRAHHAYESAPLEVAPREVLSILTVLGEGRVRSAAGEESLAPFDTIVLAAGSGCTIDATPGDAR